MKKGEPVGQYRYKKDAEKDAKRARDAGGHTYIATLPRRKAITHRYLLFVH